MFVSHASSHGLSQDVIAALLVRGEELANVEEMDVGDDEEEEEEV